MVDENKKKQKKNKKNRRICPWVPGCLACNVGFLLVHFFSETLYATGGNAT